MDTTLAVAELDAALAQTTCIVDVPRQWASAESGAVLPACLADMRRFRRYVLRLRTLLEYGEPLPAIARTARPHAVYTKDVSREGIGFYHCEQLFPLERVRLWLPHQPRRLVEVVRCRRVNATCYEIGGRFL